MYLSDSRISCQMRRRGDHVAKPELQQRRRAILSELSDIGDLRPGTLIARYRKCGKANCHCAADGGGHGPSWSLTAHRQGRTRTRIVSPHAVNRTRAHIEEYRRFRALLRELVDVSIQLCDAECAHDTAASSNTEP